MWQSFDDVNKVGREFAEAGMQSFASFSKGAQAIAAETTDYSRRSLEAGGRALKNVLAAGSVDKALEVQVQYAREAYEEFVAESAKLGELYADLAKEAYKPYESVVARAR